MKLKSFTETIYLNRQKEENHAIEFRAKELGFNTENILFLGYEVEMEVEIFEDGTVKILKVNGIDVADKCIDLWLFKTERIDIEWLN